MTLPMFFNSGRVRRWHQNPELSWTDDYNDAHQGRVARILLMFHPKPSLMLIAAALTHDDGELRGGDLSRDAKNANPEIRELLREVENEGYREVWNCGMVELDDDDKKWLHFADKLDAQMWMRHKAPHLATRPDWKRECRILLFVAAQFGIDDKIEEILR